MSVSEMDSLRKRIDDLDNDIVALLAERFKVTEEIGVYKAKHDLNPQDRSREADKFAMLSERAENYGLNPKYAVDIYRCIMDIVINRHLEIKASPDQISKS